MLQAWPNIEYIKSNFIINFQIAFSILRVSHLAYWIISRRENFGANFQGSQHSLASWPRRLKSFIQIKVQLAYCGLDKVLECYSKISDRVGTRPNWLNIKKINLNKKLNDAVFGQKRNRSNCLGMLTKLRGCLLSWYCDSLKPIKADGLRVVKSLQN
jgi:hypothetical protein